MVADSDIIDALARVDPERIRELVFALSRDFVPCRTLNYCLPGRAESTLAMVDELLTTRLESDGYLIERQVVPVQAFVPDASVPHGFRKPQPDEPWFDAVNLVCTRRGTDSPDEMVVIVAHKDSQSWLDCGPGAYDNAVGVAALMEIARVLATMRLGKSVRFLLCNEEHWPWTSVAAARRIAEQAACKSLQVLAVINLDSLGGKSQAEISAGQPLNVTRYVTAEGERLADLTAQVNRAYRIGLQQTKFRSAAPNDDDGSFVNAGFLNAVLNIGSMPYRDAKYHTCDDRPERVDLKNVLLATRLTLATVLELVR